MRNVPPDKYNVAWFKLAECVSRGEKERALGVYRLLAHSLNDAAFARQLQGDILLSFQDQAGALEHYRTAARLYQEDGRLLEAAAIHEHLVSLVPHKRETLLSLLNLYCLLRNTAKIVQHATTLCALLLANNETEEVAAILDQLSILSVHETVQLRQQLVFALLKQERVDVDHVMPYVHQTVDALLTLQDAAMLQRFLSAVKALHDQVYELACERISS